MSPSSTPWPGTGALKTSPSAWCACSKAGSMKCSMKFPPPSTAGTPRKPARIEPAARICSGTIMVFGDSWTCFACSAVPRKLPPKVIQ